jgi:polyphosphate kinase
VADHLTASPALSAGSPLPALAPPEPPALSLKDPSLYVNRELSLLTFQRRVLEEAQDPANPLLERFKFLAILGSNLDEFFMVRVAALKQKLASNADQRTPDGLTVPEALAAIREAVTGLMEDAYSLLNNDLLPALASAGIGIVPHDEISPAGRRALRAWFADHVFPVLTPLAYDPGRPFPHISNLSLNLSVVVREGKGPPRFARVKVPDTLPKLVPVPAAATGAPGQTLVWLDQLIAANLDALFPGLDVLESHPFHVTRDAEVVIQELESDDLLETVEEAVWRRRFREVVRLQVGVDIPDKILSFLTENINPQTEIYRLDGPLDLARLSHLSSLDRPELKFAPYTAPRPAGLHAEADLFTAIRAADRLLQHPYESFQPVVDFLEMAARDPDVLAIKMTLYRVGANSPVVQALLDAVQNGKQVVALVELKARFDEESNIDWARALENEGVHVIYGLVGLKVHCKVAMVVRREGESIQRYIHLGTGNYNPVTARLYTDLSYLTCDQAIAGDVTDLFNYLTGYSAKQDFRRLLIAPITLRRRLEELIHREIGHGTQGHLIFKMNALEDEKMIRLLYEASQAGVRCDLLVRGICCLRPGVPGVSDNIRVISVVGRFLEHSRIYYFRNGGDEQIYSGSADLMPRNLNRRVEVAFPILGRKIVRRIRDEILGVYLQDTERARVMQPDGSYVRRRGEAGQTAALDSQAHLLERGT